MQVQLLTGRSRAAGRRAEEPTARAAQMPACSGFPWPGRSHRDTLRASTFDTFALGRRGYFIHPSESPRMGWSGGFWCEPCARRIAESKKPAIMAMFQADLGSELAEQSCGGFDPTPAKSGVKSLLRAGRFRLTGFEEPLLDQPFP